MQKGQNPKKLEKKKTASFQYTYESSSQKLKIFQDSNSRHHKSDIQTLISCMTRRNQFHRLGKTFSKPEKHQNSQLPCKFMGIPFQMMKRTADKRRRNFPNVPDYVPKLTTGLCDHHFLLDLSLVNCHLSINLLLYFFVS